MASIIQGVKGARDFYPEEMAFRSYLYGIIRKVSTSYGFQEYDGPFLEKIDLYAAKSGEELVKEQSFVFPDRGGDLITLRPELTPSLARMVATRQNELVFPLRWWSFGPFWRYERPQKGRSREFFQWNIDLIGVNSVAADLELLSIGCAFFAEAGLTGGEVVIALNDRQLMELELLGLGVPAGSLRDVYRLIDRREKMNPESWMSYGAEIGLDPGQLAGIENILTNKDLWKKSERLVTIISLLADRGFAGYVEYDPGIIRGLDYYTGIVFEARDREGGRALFGGGRYDNLVGDVGGQPAGGIGFAMGDVVIKLTLEKYNRIPVLPVKPAQILVTLFDVESIRESLAIAGELRKNGLNVEVYPEAYKLQKQLKYADRSNIRFIIVLGPDEISGGTVTVKDLKNNTQVSLDRNKLTEHLMNA